VANIGEVTSEDKENWDTWTRSRPDHVRRLIEERHLAPWKLYRMKSTGRCVILHSFDEEFDGKITLKVIVSGRFNLISFERTVFGVDPNDIEECDLPDKSKIES
jgi:hypothetical protein